MSAVFGPCYEKTCLSPLMQSINRTRANSADPDQTPLNEASGQGLHCLQKKNGLLLEIE